mmetsp:Transcript_19445/g.54076  ORF Transcript_19445/g.54076 Transcript_19445/m.54076 type:complete len:263 (+) Transcript_19445:375-1163(+)
MAAAVASLVPRRPWHPRRHCLLRSSGGAAGGVQRRQAPAHQNGRQAGALRRARHPVHRLPHHQRRPRMGLRAAAVPLPLDVARRQQGRVADRHRQHLRGPLHHIRRPRHVLRPAASSHAHAVVLPPRAQAPSSTALPDARLPRRRQRASHRALRGHPLHVDRGVGRRAFGRCARHHDLLLLQPACRLGHAQSFAVRSAMEYPGSAVQRRQPRDASSQVHRQLRAVLHVVRSSREDLCGIRRSAGVWEGAVAWRRSCDAEGAG